MQKSLVACVAVAALVFMAPKPASAATVAAPAIHYGETNAGMVQEVGRRYGSRPYYPYGYYYGNGYGYRPYYGYGYGYRPYGSL